MIEQIQKIIDKYDPINLYPGEVSPDDEYLSEAKIINNNLLSLSNYDLFHKEIEKLFIDRFDKDVVDKEKLESMAKEIFARCR